MFELIRKDPRDQAAGDALRRIDSAAECLHTVLANGICTIPLTNQALEVFKTVIAAYEVAATELDDRMEGRDR